MNKKIKIILILIVSAFLLISILIYLAFFKTNKQNKQYISNGDVFLRAECGHNLVGHKEEYNDSDCIFKYTNENPPIFVECNAHLYEFYVETTSEKGDRATMKCYYSELDRVDQICSMCIHPNYPFKSLLDILVVRITWFRWRAGLL